MMNKLDNSPILSSNSKKKSYSKMKVSRLGSLSELTQGNQPGMYTDGLNMMAQTGGGGGMGGGMSGGMG